MNILTESYTNRFNVTDRTIPNPDNYIYLLSDLSCDQKTALTPVVKWSTSSFDIYTNIITLMDLQKEILFIFTYKTSTDLDNFIEKHLQIKFTDFYLLKCFNKNSNFLLVSRFLSSLIYFKYRIIEEIEFVFSLVAPQKTENNKENTNLSIIFNESELAQIYLILEEFYIIKIEDDLLAAAKTIDEVASKIAILKFKDLEE